MARPTNPLLFTSCSILMASLFALSATFQFNDPDWYFWIPLYICATIVNMVNSLGFKSNKMTKTAKFALWLGLFLLIKVVIEDVKGEIAGIWSVDMRERVVREKLGSGFVIVSMFLHLQVATQCYAEYGMALLVALSYGISFIFFVFQKNEMKF